MPITLAVGSALATIRPDLGGRLASLTIAGDDVIRTEDESRGLGWAFWGAYPLIPWSNRVVGGRLRMHGETYVLPTNWPDGSAIHGLVASSPWSIVASNSDSAVLSNRVRQGPWSLHCESTFVLKTTSLTWSISAQNIGDRDVAVGLGIHPWFRQNPISVPASSYWPTHDNIPSGSPCRVDAHRDLRQLRHAPPFDVCYTGIESNSAQVGDLEMSWTGPIEHIVVYTADAEWLCVEPVTNVNDAFNLRADGIVGHGLVDLAPRQSQALSYVFDWSRLVDRVG